MFSNQNIIIQEHAAFPKIFDYERNIATLTHPKILNAHFDPNPLYFTNKIVRTINYLQMFEKKQRFQKTRVDQFEIFWKKLSKIFQKFLFFILPFLSPKYVLCQKIGHLWVWRYWCYFKLLFFTWRWKFYDGINPRHN